MSLDELTQKQAEEGHEVQRLLTNMKKDGKSRATPAYIQKRGEDLEVLWNRFGERHAEILQIEGHSTHEYCVKDFYALVKDAYTQAREYLTSLKSLTVSTPKEKHEGEEHPNQQDRPVGSSMLLRKQLLKMERLMRTATETRRQLATEQANDFWEMQKEYIREQWRDIEELQDDLILNENQSAYTNGYLDLEGEVQAILMKLCEITSHDRNGTDKMPLPNVKLPIFEGDYGSWTNFHDLFNKLVHTNKRLTNVEKMQHLKTNLKGEASKLLHHMQVSDSNYETAWKMLTKRYENKRLLLSTQLKNIFGVPKMNFNSAEDLREIHDRVTESLQAIGNLGIHTNSWGPIVMHMLMEKLDKATIHAYESSLQSPKDVPEFEGFMSFLETRFQCLELTKVPKPPAETFGKEKWSARTHHSQLSKCLVCKDLHNLYSCKKFLELSPRDRYNLVKGGNLCFNCLKHDKNVKCSSKNSCNKCKRHHHTLLHFESAPRSSGTTEVSTHVSVGNREANLMQVLLATAIVHVKNHRGEWACLRVLLDTGSQTSFITEGSAELLGLPRRAAHVQVNGMGTVGAGTVRGKIAVEMTARCPTNFNMTCNLLIMKRLTSSLPAEESDGLTSKHMKNKLLADPHYNIPGPIDILLGADVIPYIMKAGLKKPKEGCLLQNTEFGWIVSGKFGAQTGEDQQATSLISLLEDSALTRFWEIEEVQEVKLPQSVEDRQCQELYTATTTRGTDFTYTVGLPLKEGVDELGDSKAKATARLLQMEKKFRSDPIFESTYKEFMKDYENLGHMAPVEAGTEKTKYYIPHHAVIKEDSTTTKLRVVFDASSKTTTGRSLNDFMFTGPRLQEDLSQLLLRWRQYSVVLSADIAKMFRQIKVREQDLVYQTILWRYSTKDPIQEYRLTTVTYGMAAAPFLAVRTLQQLAVDENATFPMAAKVTGNDFYMDDLITGSHSLAEAMTLQKQLLSLLQRGGFMLRKWKSNYKEIVSALPNELQDKEFMEVDSDYTRKTLGVHWAPLQDTFGYKVEIALEGPITKRKILSQVARLYDPLGWVAPIVIKSKMLIQELWLNELEWDDELPEMLKSKWLQLQEDLRNVQRIEIPRWCKYSTDTALDCTYFVMRPRRHMGL